MFRNTSASLFADLIRPGDIEMLQRVYELALAQQRIGSSVEADRLAATIVQAYLSGESSEVRLIERCRSAAASIPGEASPPAADAP